MATGFFTDLLDALAGVMGLGAPRERPRAVVPSDDELRDPTRIRAGWAERAEAAGWTRERFRAASREVESRLSDLEVESLRISGWDLSWAPRPLRFGTLTTGGKNGQPGKTRVIGHAGRGDEVLMAVWRGLAGPILERQLPDHVHGFRRGRGTKSAIAALTRGGFPPGAALVRADVKSMFPSLKHGWLTRAIRLAWGPEPASGQAEVDLRLRLAGLAERWVTSWGQVGVPTGTSISPMLSNAYFASGVDRWLDGALASGRLAAGVRYADDFGLVTTDPVGVLGELRASCAACGLQLNDTKTLVIPAAELARDGVSVLGVPLTLVGERLVTGIPAGAATRR